MCNSKSTKKKVLQFKTIWFYCENGQLEVKNLNLLDCKSYYYAVKKKPSKIRGHVFEIF